MDCAYTWYCQRCIGIIKCILQHGYCAMHVCLSNMCMCMCYGCSGNLKFFPPRMLLTHLFALRSRFEYWNFYFTVFYSMCLNYSMKILRQYQCFSCCAGLSVYVLRFSQPMLSHRIQFWISKTYKDHSIFPYLFGCTMFSLYVWKKNYNPFSFDFCIYLCMVIKDS